MSTHPNDMMRQTLFVLKESAATKRLVPSASWPTATVQSPDQWLAAFERARHESKSLVAVVAEEDLESSRALLAAAQRDGRWLAVGFIVIAKDPAAHFSRGRLPSEILDVISEKEARSRFELHVLRAAKQMAALSQSSSTRLNADTLERLNQIFISLSIERNSEKLLEKILTHALEISSSAAGTLYLTQEIDGEMYFKARVTGERGKPCQLQPISSRVMENSLCGYVTLTGKSLNVSDLNTVRTLSLPQYSRLCDHDDTGVVSLLTLPLRNSRFEAVGVLQLVNKEIEGSYRPFQPEDEALLNSLGSQAAFCLENVDLYSDIQRLFEGFVKASITAIESRDPSTGGHSERVAKLCVALARATTDCEIGIYRSVRFKEEEIRELEYAALLHDFGKIGVREEVLVKAKKLYSYQLEAIQERIKICKAAARIACLERQLQGDDRDLQCEKAYQDRVREIDGYWEIILAANEPAIIKRENMEALEKIRREQLLLPDGSPIALLSEEEYRALAVTRGSLTESERLEIESHVRHTHQFLKMIPWTKDFKHLTEIAYCHHEKLDGSGYPRGLMSHEIPLQSKIMTISDIYDALTAADRWYKEAVPTERAIEILAEEVREGKIDPVLFEIFVERRIFEVTQSRAMLQNAG